MSRGESPPIPGEEGDNGFMTQESGAPPSPREKELLDRIRHLEDQNSALQDRLDMIWSILEPDYQLPDDQVDADDSEDSGLVQINPVK